MSRTRQISALVLTAVALAMGVVSVVLSIVGETPIGTNVTLLGIGLFALAVASLLALLVV